MPENLRGKLLLSFAFGLLVLLALGLYADVSQVAGNLGAFDWELLPLILGLTLFNYALRFGKWHYYLGQLGVRGISLADSAVIFVSGMTMVMTPGKVGELLKSYLLKQVTGTPVSASAPIVVAERLTDGLAMLLLASFGLLLYPQGWPLLAVIAAGGLALVIVSQQRVLVLRLLEATAAHHRLSRLAHSMRSFYESTYQLFGLKNLLLAVAVGFVSWAGECLAFYWVLVGFGLEATATLLVQATFVLALSTLVGSVSMLPGGLGVADGSVTGLLQLLTSVGGGVAVAATIVIRFCTLWFGVSLGILTLVLFRSRFAQASALREPQNG